MIGLQESMARARELEELEEWSEAAEAYNAVLDASEINAPEVLFSLGHVYFHMQMLAEAAAKMESATVLRPGVAAWHYRLGYVLEKLEEPARAAEQYGIAISLQPNRPRWQHRLEVTSVEASRARETRLEAQRVRAASQRSRVKDLVSRKAPKWQEIEALEAGLQLHNDDPQWLTRLAEGQFFMNRISEAAVNFAAAAALEPDNAELHFREGWSWELLGDHDKANRAYRRAIHTDSALDAATFGIGVFFQRRGRWASAAKAFEASLRNKPLLAELHYKLGLASQRCYDWAAAANSLRNAVALDPAVPQWHYRLGFSFERQGSWQDAAAAYEYAIAIHDSAPAYWQYRLGYVRVQANSYEAACQAFASTQPFDDASVQKHLPSLSSASENYISEIFARTLHVAMASQSATLCHEAGVRLEASGHPGLAAAAFLASVRRTEKHTPARYYRLGRALQNAKDFEGACNAYLETRHFKRAHGVDTAQYLKNKDLKQSMVYTEYLETLNIESETILYESGHGNSVSCNPLQIYRNLISDPRFEAFTHVWVLNDKDRIPQEMRSRENVIFVARDTDLYLRYLATAGYLINNNTFPPYFTRRKNQQYLNTWHGTPLKTLGRDIKNGFMDHRNAARNFLHATHMIAPNRFTADCLIEKYDVAGLFPGKLAVTGYPRVDSTINTDQNAKDDLRRRLGISVDRKVVLYAPTWRGSLGSTDSDNQQVLDTMACLMDLDCHPLFRGHAMVAGTLENTALYDFLVPEDLDTNDLLSIVDVLITDYSSIFFDFMATGKPIVYFAYDLAEYSADRGLYFDLETMPGRVALETESLKEEVVRAMARDREPDQKYRQGMATFCGLEDGNSTQRTIDFFFFEDGEHVLDTAKGKKQNVLMYQGSFIPNGITTSYLNLVRHIDLEKNRVCLVVEPVTVKSEERRLDKFAQNPSHVQVLGRVGGQLVTAEERWVIDKFNAIGDFAAEEQREIYHRAFEREFRRMFGYAVFDSVVCFEGYARFWAALFANSTNPGARKSIYLHNDMHREWLHRFRYLESMFRLYGSYQQLVSVTKSVSEENVRQLSAKFDLRPELFTFCNNVVNAEESKQLATEALDGDLADWIGGDTTLFLTLGRLSPEKGHAKLIRAFAKIVDSNPNCKLAILGDGPLKEDLESLIQSLSLESHVLLAGLWLNPFPALERADCFVFSSDYEGQGLVVLEALILNKPVVSTDVVGPKSVLEGGYGMLVDNSVNGLVDGMRGFLSGKMNYKPFDYELYQKEAIQKFEEVVLGFAEKEYEAPIRSRR
ncbi:CDP-glycerol glycerophosphotransferase family protein [Paenarthrobacter sp. PH39-S1]|uniref:CDP-glycerol glycerophosphotransferase family protein n=1 Tax=Paenarthrobacter sp. PH39-S1 TaxID=3046204 RepID=UPI0024BA3FB1|nr:CDP-glycerol glycerophosphotransferase family protein [Paenarthrobacter sp. PH39-S1]MDJ0356572.1 CDP-glycerol glycerophosphotransferase family protein [Paenarthrobacter sp. PH39-S1]